MLKKKLKNNAKKVDSFIKSYLIKQKKSQLLKPMKYGILSGGKKIRSSIIMSTGKIYKLSLKKLLFISAAVAVTPSRIFNSAVLLVTPSRRLSSVVVAVTPTNAVAVAALPVTLPVKLPVTLVVTKTPLLGL